MKASGQLNLDQILVIINQYCYPIMYSKGKAKLDTSAQALNNKYYNVDPLDIEQTKIYKKQKKRAKNQGLSYLYQNDYKPASYKRALEFKNSMSYKQKMGDGSYREIELFESTDELKTFGLGPYFFIQFQRRIVWLFFALSVIMGVLIYINWSGTGLSEYEPNYSTYLFMSTLGNFDTEVLTGGYDTYLVTLIPCVAFFGTFIFYLIWKCHYNNTIDQEMENSEFIKPEKFCVQVEGFKDEEFVKEEDLERVFSEFGPIYQVSIARQYAGKLKYFQELDDLEEQIKEEELEIVLGYGDKQNLVALKKEKDALQKYINTLQIKPSTVSAYIHYQFEKNKVDMLSYYSDHYLFSSLSHGCFRHLCCCCLDQPNPKLLYKGQNLYVKESLVPEPEDINWDHYEVGCCGKITRGVFACFIILIFLALSCAIIGICSLYILTNAEDCQGIAVPQTLTEARTQVTTEKQMQCYCMKFFFQAFTDDGILNFCGQDRIDQLSISTGIQYAITITSSIVNILFGIIVDKLINLTQPLSFSKGYMWKNSIYTLFIIFNTVFLPLLLYADIFGFKAAHYVSFVTIISSDIKNFFNVESLSFFIDFDKIWYKNVSPIYSNFIIIDMLLTWVFFIVYKCISSKSGLEEEEGRMLQKHMNSSITSWKLNVYVQYSYFNLIVFMGLIFCAGAPILLVLAFLNLFSKYLTNRSLIQNNSSKIVGLGESFNSAPLFLIPLTLVLAPIINAWMLTGNQYVLTNDTMKIDFGLSFEILNRELILPFYLILSIIVVLEFLLYNTLIRFCGWLASCCYDKKKVVHPYYTREYTEYAREMSILYSYNIRNNMKYKNAIFNLQKYLEINDIK